MGRRLCAGRLGRQVTVAAALLLAGVQAHALDYRVTYRGVFSLGQDMPVADVAMAERDVAGGALKVIQLDATSEKHAVMESLYPVRYRIAAWVGAADGGIVALDSYEKTNKTKHRLYIRDDSASGMFRLDRLAGEGETEARRLLDGAFDPPDAPPLFDRLGLLAQLRERVLDVGQRFALPVTNGRERMEYEVTVEGAATLPLAGRRVPALKLRLDAWEPDGNGGRQAAHRPAFVWLATDAGHTPLRLEVRHAIGLFRADLLVDGAALSVAALGPR
ncbi:MAG: DUF3108 domain-containing protein [Gammaproteobacteria bacterium]|nr:DUF3108 domain-containing protein [Gammaproteobacteria bacterium]